VNDVDHGNQVVVWEGSRLKDISAALCLYVHATVEGVSLRSLFLPDVLPVSLTRTYRPEDSNNRPFGIGATHPYAIFFTSAGGWHEIDLVLPHGGRIRYNCIAGANCNDWTTAQLEPTSSQTEFYKSKVIWNGNGWNLTFKDSTVYVLTSGDEDLTWCCSKAR